MYSNNLSSETHLPVYQALFPAQITGVTMGGSAQPGQYLYSFFELSYNPITGLTIPLLGGRTGTAYEINNQSESSFPFNCWMRANTVVQAAYSYAIQAFEFELPLFTNNIIYGNTEPTGNTISLVSNANCTSGTLNVTNTNISAYVLIDGLQFPVYFLTE